MHRAKVHGVFGPDERRATRLLDHIKEWCERTPGIDLVTKFDTSNLACKFAGEVSLGSVQRGPFQTAYVGYWVDEAEAGRGYVPEGYGPDGVAMCAPQ